MAKNIRWVTFLGQDGSGKTSLIEVMLYLGKGIKKFRRIDGGSSPLDTEDEEKKRNFTLQSRPATAEHNKTRLVFWDTPGFTNFMAEVKNVTRVGDAAVLVVSAVRGLKDVSILFLDVLQELNKPFAVFINHLDDPEGDFSSALASVEEALGKKPAVLTYPIGRGEEFKGFVNVLAGEALYYEEPYTGKVKKGDVPGEIKGEIETLKENLVETAIEVDDALTEKYLEGEELTPEEISNAIRKSFQDGHFVPVFAGSAYLNVGVKPLMDFVVDAFPSPEDAPSWKGTLNNEEVEVPLSDDGKVSAYVLKTTVDHYAGKISYLRVVSGRVKPEIPLIVSRTGEKIKVSQLVTIKGVEHVTAPEVPAGDILILKKVDTLNTGDTVAEEGFPVVYPPFEIPKRVLSYVVRPKGKASEEKVSGALQKIIDEDPLLEATRDPDTKDLLLWGMGQVHLEVVQERLQRKFGVEIEFDLPKVPYRETIKSKAQAQGKYKKQSGGRGQYGDAWIQIEPLPRGKGFEFVDMIKGGVIPKNFIPAVEKGVKEAMQHGPLAGYPVIDVKVTLYDGSYHEVDSSDIAFQIAGSLAFKNAVPKANPTLLEPIMKVEITVPEAFVGAVMNDLNSRRAKIMGIDVEKHGKVIRAEVPMAEMLTYAPQLRALTQGMGTFTMDFDHYEEVPPHLVNKIVEESPYKKKEEE